MPDQAGPEGATLVKAAFFPVRAGRWRWVVGAGLLFILVALVDPRALAGVVAGASPGWLAGVVALACAWFVLGGLNLFLLVRRLHPVRLRTVLDAYLTGWMGSLLIPGQLGDATLVLVLRRQAVPAATGSAAYVLDKTVSLTWLVLVAAYGVGRYTPQLRAWWLPALSLGGLLAGAVGIAVFRRVAAGAHGPLGRALERLFGELAAFRRHPGTVALNVGLTIVRWGLTTSLYWAAFRAFDAPIPLEAAATIPVMSSLVGYIPVTVAGAGTVEWTAVLIFAQVGVEDTAVVTVYLVLRAVLVLAALGLLVSSRR